MARNDSSSSEAYHIEYGKDFGTIAELQFGTSVGPSFSQEMEERRRTRTTRKVKSNRTRITVLHFNLPLQRHQHTVSICSRQFERTADFLHRFAKMTCNRTWTRFWCDRWFEWIALKCRRYPRRYHHRRACSWWIWTWPMHSFRSKCLPVLKHRSIHSWWLQIVFPLIFFAENLKRSKWKTCFTSGMIKEKEHD